MKNRALLKKLLVAESENQASEVLDASGLWDDRSKWKPIGGMRNNQSVVHAQQSNPEAALIEKYTNGLDALLMRHCKASGRSPRGSTAPRNMKEAVTEFFGNLADLDSQEIRKLAEENLVLYATGSKDRPCVSLYDAGEGQQIKDFPSTFCSLVHGSDDGSYKGAIPFVQGRFNMGGTGVLPFCGEKHKMQLIVSRVPAGLAPDPGEWGFTVFRFFPSKSSPEWRFLCESDGSILAAGKDPLGLVPKIGAKSGELCAPHEREVSGGTLVKMYDYKAPRGNVCGDLYRKINVYLLEPAMPMRIVECRNGYKANVMGVTVWDQLSSWGTKELEEGFEEGAGLQLELSTEEVVSGEIRVFRAEKEKIPRNAQTGLRALINGQSHGRRDHNFFKTNAIDKEHIATSLLVTLDCTGLGQDSRNDLFMANRETFRDGTLLPELLRKLQKELRGHEGLILLDQKRYEEKIGAATTDEDGISALEELLSTDPALAELFGSNVPGRVAAQNVDQKSGTKVKGDPKPFVGTDFPTKFERADGSTTVRITIPRGSTKRVSFLTDVKNSYFNRHRHRGHCDFVGNIVPTFHLFNGRLTLAFSTDSSMVEGTQLTTLVEIYDNACHGPFDLTIESVVVAPEQRKTRSPKQSDPKVDAAASRPEIKEVLNGPDDPAIVVDKKPGSDQLTLIVNKGSRLLERAKSLRKTHEAAAVEFVFKYGLALVAMGLIDDAKKTDDWKTNEAACRERIGMAASGIGRVIVPLCLTLPNKLPALRKFARVV